jgi:hypothetical protein
MTKSESVVIIALLGATSAEAATSVDDAFRLCALIDVSGLTSAKCSVSGWNSSVDFSIGMSGAEANKACTALASIAKSKSLQFEHGWTIRIFSPFSSGNTIATCAL